MPPRSEPAAPVPPPDVAWHRLPIDDVLARLHAGTEGLSAAEAAQRLAADGPNALPATRRLTPLHLLAGQFKSLVIWILLAAGAVSGFLGERLEAVAILFVVVLNAAIGFYQEFKAEKSISALRQLTAPHARVRRDGRIESVPATSIVAGDLLVLEAGDLVAADARLLHSSALTCVESTLTGESAAVDKAPAPLDQADLPLGDRANLVFMGTSVAAGTGQAVVVATAMNTELGRIAALLSTAGTETGTPLEKKLESFGRVLVWAALGIVALLFGLGLLRGTPPLELFMTSVGLAVAAVPEGLPAVVTVALALGVRRMSRRRALVRRLAAVETLGSTSVICTDKTGTLTVGAMTARALFVAGRNYTVTGEGYGPAGEIQIDGRRADGPHTAPLHELATVLLGCNHAHLIEDAGRWTATGDPTEAALLTAGLKAGVDRAQIDRTQPAFHTLPFDSDRKLATVIRRLPDGRLRAYLNGAPDVLLARCSRLFTADAGIRALTDEDRRQLSEQNAALAGQALRVLGSAWRDLAEAAPDALTPNTVEHDLVFVGLTGLQDPPRPEAKDAIARCHAAGIRVVMITGDHPQTAAAIAHELGLASDTAPLTGVDVDQLSDEALQQRVSTVAVYARVTAAHKLRIVRALRANRDVVAMTGDGVNDAPAIKGADIGIAMGQTGTEVTKEAADMIITDDNFATIVAAVEEGRGIYDNIRKTLQYLLAGSAAELLLMTACVLLGLPMPLLAIHLLWINLVTDGLPALCLATDPVDSAVMRRHPRAPGERLTTPAFLRTMLWTGSLTAAVAFGVYYYTLQTGTLAAARTAAFAVMVFAELLRSFGARSETVPVWRISLRTNLPLVAVVALSFALQLWSQHSAILGRWLRTEPLPFSSGLWLVALGTIPLLALEAGKLLQARRTARILPSDTPSPASSRPTS